FLLLLFFFFTLRQTPRSTLFPYTTLFRSRGFNYGIYYLGIAPVNVRVSRVSVSGCFYHGIFLDVTSTVVESCMVRTVGGYGIRADRKSTRLNSSHVAISYAVFCLKKKKR